MYDLITRLHRFAEVQPTAIAYTADGNSISYSELYRQAEYYGNLLKRQGTSPVMLLGHKQCDFLVAMLSCIFAQRAYIPIDTSIPLERIKKILTLSSAELVLSFDDKLDYEDFSAFALNDLERYQNCSAKISDNSTAYIIFTSGSTGEPKGVPISYDNLNNFIHWISGIKPLNSYKNITVLNQALFSFDLSVADIYYSLFNGHTLASLDRQDIESFDYVFKTISEKKPELMVITPTFARLCLTDKLFCGENFPFLKCIYFCGEVLEPSTASKLFARFPKLEILNAYGPTEATSAVSATMIAPEMIKYGAALPVGKLGEFATEIEIIDGEIVLKGKSVFGGYLGSSIGGHYREKGVNCYRTGDNGKIEGNLLYCLGRRDRQVKLNGYRIEPDEIESRISSIDGVTACAAVPSYSPSSRLKCINAFVCGTGIDEDMIRVRLKKSLPSYMIPRNIKIVDKLAVNSNGKIDRKALMGNEKN